MNLLLEKPLLTYRFHEIKKEHEGFGANIGVRVRMVRGILFEN
jgi:hypothetical protein